MRDNSLFLESDTEYFIIFSFSYSPLTEVSPFPLYLSHTVWSFSFRGPAGISGLFLQTLLLRWGEFENPHFVLQHDVLAFITKPQF